MRLADSAVITLTENLRLKVDMFQELDDKIIEQTKKLGAAVYEAADLQAVLSEKMALITHTLATSSPIQQVIGTQPQQSDVENVNISNSNNDSSHQPAADPSDTHAHSTAHMAHTTHALPTFPSLRSPSSLGSHLIGSHFGTALKLPLTPTQH